MARQQKATRKRLAQASGQQQQNHTAGGHEIGNVKECLTIDTEKTWHTGQLTEWLSDAITAAKDDYCWQMLQEILGHCLQRGLDATHPAAEAARHAIDTIQASINEATPFTLQSRLKSAIAKAETSLSPEALHREISRCLNLGMDTADPVLNHAQTTMQRLGNPEGEGEVQHFRIIFDRASGQSYVEGCDCSRCRVRWVRVCACVCVCARARVQGCVRTCVRI